MKQLLIKVMVIFVFFTITAGRVESADWKYFGSIALFDCYYDSTSIKNLDGDIIRVCTKWVIKDKKSLDEFIKLMQKEGASIKGYENFEHALYWQELNYTTKQYRIISVTNYAKGGTVLFNTNYPADWMIISPESIIEALSKVLRK